MIIRINGNSYIRGKQLFPDFKFPYPVSNNRYYRRHGYIMHISAAGQKFKQWVHQQYYGDHEPVKCYVAIVICYQPKMTKDGDAYKTLLDWDNCGTKCICDSLQGIAYVNDKQIKDGQVIFGDPIKKGGCIVRVFKLEQVTDSSDNLELF